jgi:hypothetical protein
MKLVEEYRGVGVLSWRGRNFEDIPYSISRFQAMTSGGLPVPGLHRIEGTVEVGPLLATGAPLTDTNVSLALEDGRTLNLTVVDDAGRVLAEGHGPSRCSCC